jgi:uncharacterized membrane protein
MVVGTFFAYSGGHANAEDALADCEAVHALHTDGGLIGASDAAVLRRKPDGKVRIVKSDTPGAVGALRGGVGLA